jgi:hypothetical protein
MNEFTKEELIALKNGIDYLPQVINMSSEYKDMCAGIISKIESMIESQPKYKVGQEVWFLKDKEICSFVISDIVNTDTGAWYIHNNFSGFYTDMKGNFDQYCESDLFPSQEDLIQAQIDYWQDKLQ